MWRALVVRLGTVAGLEQVYCDEIFSKLDPVTYGTN